MPAVVFRAADDRRTERLRALQCRGKVLHADAPGADAADARDDHVAALHGRRLRNNTTALLPPNARLVDNPTFSAGSARGSPTTTSRPSAGSAGSSPAVGGASRCTIDNTVNTASMPPAAPSRCPTRLFDEVTGILALRAPNTAWIALLSASSLCGVPVPCAFTNVTASGGRFACCSASRIAAEAPAPLGPGAATWGAS